MKKYKVTRDEYIKSLSYSKVINTVGVVQTVLGIILLFGSYISRVIGLTISASALFIAVVSAIVDFYYSCKD